MRTFELRVYKLRTKEALDFYMNQIYPRHLSSLPIWIAHIGRFVDAGDFVFGHQPRADQ
jgi:hypothetical protein